MTKKIKVMFLGLGAVGILFICLCTFYIAIYDVPEANRFLRVKLIGLVACHIVLIARNILIIGYQIKELSETHP